MCWLSSYHEADANYSDGASGSSRPIVDSSIGIDGEAIVVDQRGLSAFDLLRSWRLGAHTRAFAFVGGVLPMSLVEAQDDTS